jgi:hypothetical protein
MLDNQKIDDSLLISETSLVYIPRDKFQVDSWVIFDEFMVYAANVFTTTLANLIKAGYIRILEATIKTFKPLGITISTTTNYSIQLAKKPPKEFVIGWLEEKIIEQFNYSNNNKLDTIIYDTLSEIFHANQKVANPGKVLVLAIIQHQKLNLYNFNHKKNWISNSITLWYNKDLYSQLKPRIYKIEEFVLPEIEISVLKEIVSAQLGKFQHLD